MCQEGLFTSVYRKRSQNAAFTVEGFKEDFFGSQQWFLSSSPVGPPQEQAWTWCRWQVWQSDRFSQGSDPRLRCRSAPVLMVQQQTRVKVSCKNASSAAVWSSPNEEDPLSLTSELPNVIVPPHGGGSRCSPTRVRRLMFINVLFKTVRFCAAASLKHLLVFIFPLFSCRYRLQNHHHPFGRQESEAGAVVRNRTFIRASRSEGKHLETNMENAAASHRWMCLS